MSCSETESEPEPELTIENVSSLAAFAQLATKQSQDNAAPRSVNWAIDTLATLDFRLVRKDTTLHGVIQDCATTILGFFDTLLRQQPANISSSILIADIASMFKPSFLHLLFQYRRLFYAIAMRDLSPSSAPPAVICWVDIVLAKLGDVAAFVAAGLHGDHNDQEFPSVLKAQKQEDSLRAATQLPDNWDIVPSVLLSERVSTSAKRLSLRLMLGRYILHPALSGNAVDSTIQKSFSILWEFVRQTARRIEDLSSVSGPSILCLIQQERFTCAVAISLLAATEMAQDSDSSNTPENTFRPRTIAAAMQLLRFVLRGEENPPGTEPLIPLDHLDSATSVLIRWGVVPQWTWIVWSECGNLHTDTIISLTTTYIQQHRMGSGTSLTVGDLAPTGVSQRCQSAVIGVMIELIFRYSLLLSTSTHPLHFPTSMMDVLCGICGFMAQWIELNTCGIRGSIECGKALITLFCHLSRAEHYVSLKDKALECLVLMEAQCTHDAWEITKGDPKLRILGSLDQAFIQSKKSLLQEDLTQCAETSAAQLMRFLVVTMSKGIKPPTLEGIVTFLGVVRERIFGTDPNDSTFLRETLLTCLATSNLFSSGLEIHESVNGDALWQVGLLGRSGNLFVTYALALYITSMPPRVDSLTYLEGLDHLLDTTLLICSRYYLCDDEPLGLIVLPTICDALLHLLEHKDDNTGLYIGTNARLAVLGNLLRSLESGEGSTSNGYNAMLLQRLSASRVAKLASEIGAHSEELRTQSEPRPERASRGYELLLCRLDGLSHLMLVPERIS